MKNCIEMREKENIAQLWHPLTGKLYSNSLATASLTGQKSCCSQGNFLCEKSFKKLLPYFIKEK